MIEVVSYKRYDEMKADTKTYVTFTKLKTLKKQTGLSEMPLRDRVHKHGFKVYAPPSRYDTLFKISDVLEAARLSPKKGLKRINFFGNKAKDAKF